MVDFKKRKILITILLIIVIALYLLISVITFISFLEESAIAAIVLLLFQNLSYLGFNFAQIFALLIVPTVIILTINSKKFDLEKSVQISRILIITSCLIIFSVFLLNLMYLTWINDQSGINGDEIAGLTTFPVLFVVLLIINIITYLLMTLKLDF